MSVRESVLSDCECSRVESGDLCVLRRVVGSIGSQHDKQRVDRGPVRFRDVFGCVVMVRW